MKDTYRIDGKTVSKAVFKKLLATLKETGGWFCEESTDGGRTGWDAQDPQGVKYRYVAVNEGSTNTQDLDRVP